MKKLALLLAAGMVLTTAQVCFSVECNCTETQKKSVLLEKIEDSTHSMAETIGEKSSVAAEKTGEAVKCGAKKAKRAAKRGAKKTGEIVKSEAKKAGRATKRGAKKATNWSARKIRNGAEKVIIKTEEVPEVVTESAQ